MEMLQPYKHTGKFDAVGPLLAMTAIGIIGMPLAYLYAFFTHLVPFIYLDVFAAAGYGFLAGFVGSCCLKYGKVRNVSVAALAGILTGIIALYWAWSAHLRIHAHQGPLYSDLSQLQAYLSTLYENGSWSLRGVIIKGGPLLVVWVVEALIILGITTAVSAAVVDSTPFCERTNSWLCEEKKFDNLAIFEIPADLEFLKKGNIEPLRRAKARPSGATAFTRITLKYSPQPGSMRTIRVDQISQSKDNNGKVVEKSLPLMPVSVLPANLYDFISGFEQLKPLKIASSEKNTAVLREATCHLY